MLTFCFRTSLVSLNIVTPQAYYAHKLYIFRRIFCIWAMCDNKLLTDGEYDAMLTICSPTSLITLKNCYRTSLVRQQFVPACAECAKPNIWPYLYMHESTTLTFCSDTSLVTVFRIHDILVRIRIPGSIPLTDESEFRIRTKIFSDF